MNARGLALCAATGSLALLLGAFAFQYIGELAPCKMCIWQRWPHAIAIAIGGIGLLSYNRWLRLLAAGVVATGAAIALYHAGVEQAWWAGPSTCTSGDVSGLTTEELLEHILNAPLVRCDEIAWSFLGLSMAAWNAVISLGLALMWLRSFRQAQTR